MQFVDTVELGLYVQGYFLKLSNYLILIKVNSVRKYIIFQSQKGTYYPS